MEVDRRFKIALLLVLISFMVAGWRFYARHQLYNNLKEHALALDGDGFDPDSRQDLEEIRDMVPMSYLRRYDDDIRLSREGRERERLQAFFAMSKQQQDSELDRRIADEERRSKQFESWRQQREARRAASGSQGRGSNRSGGGQNAGGGNTSNGGAQAGTGGGGGRGRNRTLSARLDRSSPDMRALRGAYHIQAAQRRAALGLPPSRRGTRMVL